MTKPLAAANITITLDPVTRVQDGSTTTHAAGGLVSITGGKSYAVHVVRIHDKVGSAWTVRGVHYHAALWLNGRKVRENALVELRSMIVARFKTEVAEKVAKADQAMLVVTPVRSNKPAQALLHEVIWAFPDRTGAMPLRRVDVYMLALEEGSTFAEADTYAFASGASTAVGVEPMSLNEARALLASETATVFVRSKTPAIVKAR